MLAESLLYQIHYKFDTMQYGNNRMQRLAFDSLVQVSGGKCQEIFEMQAPLVHLNIFLGYLTLIEQGTFDATQFLQALNDDGLDPSQLTLKMTLYCGLTD